MTQLNRHSTTVTLYQGDDRAKIKELERAAYVAVETRATSARRVGDDGNAILDAAQAHDDFVREAAGRAVEVELNDIGRRKWRTLTQAHPSREDNSEDALVGGYNADTFPDALLGHEGTIVSIVGPGVKQAPPTAAELEEFLDSLNHADFQRLYSEAYMLNASQGVDPKASLVSALTQRNDETPK